MLKRKARLKTIKELSDLLPRQSYSPAGHPMEPINLIIIGSKRYVRRYFKDHGWFQADKLGAWTLTKAAIASLFDHSYKTGPMAPSYLAGHHFEMAYQKPTQADSYRRRHHLRLWRTPYKFRGRRVWAGTVSYDRSIGLPESGVPTHHIAPTLAWEENFLAHSLGIKGPTYLELGGARKGKLNTGDTYAYDGRALLIDLS